VPVKCLTNNFAVSEPNATYKQREGTKQRTSKTSSTASRASPDNLKAGVILDPIPDAPQDKLVATPARLNFGHLTEGYVYGMDLTLTNVGNMPCRFNIKPVKSATHPNLHETLACEWNKGPVAPGMTAKVTVQLMAVSGLELDECITILSESTIISVPITATVRPVSEGGKVSLPRSVRILSNARLPAVRRPG
jgi:hypothetical protein